MPDAKLIKTLEREGFFLEFPRYSSMEEIILAILNERNPRIIPSLPLFLMFFFDYQKIVSQITSEEKRAFDEAILISEALYEKEHIENHLQKMIRKNNIRAKFSEKQFEEFYSSFKEAWLAKNKEEQKNIEKQSRLRLNLDLNYSLRVLFSPAKVRILNKIFNHQTLTNTELKYYYRAISNINKSVLNVSLQNYLRVIEMTKKHTLQNS